MPDHEELKPPEPYANLAELESLFTNKLDQVAVFVTSLLGRRKPRLTRTDRRDFQHTFHRFLEQARPYILALGVLDGSLDREKGQYALVEGLLKLQMRALKVKVGPHEDALAAHIRLLTRQAKPPHSFWARHPCYQQTHAALWSFLIGLYARVSPKDLQQLFERWAESADARKHVHVTRLLLTSLRRFRAGPPRKLTDRLVTDLSEEYRICGAFFEQRLRVLVSWAQASSGTIQPWSYWKTQNLKSLLQVAENHPQLQWLVSAIDRNVRNALAHGGPAVDADTGECTFSDRERDVKWTFGEFYERTRCLTLVALAMSQFESLFQLAQSKTLAYALWARLSGTGSPSASSAQPPDSCP